MARKPSQGNALQELKTALKNKELGRLYFFHGEETFLLNHYLVQMKKQLLDPLTESFNFHRLNNETFDIRDFADAVENLPMMAENTFVQVDDIDLFKMNEGDRTKMTEILADIPDYCTVVFTYLTAQWKPDKRLKKLWEAVDENGTVVEFAKQDQRDLIAWVTRHFLARQKRISTDLCAYLIEITGGTMTTLSGEIDKIASYAVGDEIRLRTDSGATMYVTVSAVCDNYVNNYAYIHPDTYTQQLGGAAEYQTLFLHAHEGADPYEEGAKLADDEDVSRVSVNEASREQVLQMLSRLDYLVVIVVVCAGALAFIVLYNLTNINITERIREIATIKVLGFYRKETASYVFREIYILAALGGLAGVLLGKALHAFVMAQVQIDAVYFPCIIHSMTYVYAVALTIGFTVLISMAMRGRLHKIDMAESLKSVE